MHLVIEEFEWNARNWITLLSANPASRVPLCTTRFSWSCMYSRSINRLFFTFDIVKQLLLPSPYASCLLMPKAALQAILSQRVTSCPITIKSASAKPKPTMSVCWLFNQSIYTQWGNQNQNNYQWGDMKGFFPVGKQRLRKHRRKLCDASTSYTNPPSILGQSP